MDNFSVLSVMDSTISLSPTDGQDSTQTRHLHTFDSLLSWRRSQTEVQRNCNFLGMLALPSYSEASIFSHVRLFLSAYLATLASSMACKRAKSGTRRAAN